MEFIAIGQGDEIGLGLGVVSLKELQLRCLSKEGRVLQMPQVAPIPGSIPSTDNPLNLFGLWRGWYGLYFSIYQLPHFAS